MGMREEPAEEDPAEEEAAELFSAGHAALAFRFVHPEVIGGGEIKRLQNLASVFQVLPLQTTKVGLVGFLVG